MAEQEKDEKIDWRKYNKISAQGWGFSVRECRKNEYWNIVMCSGGAHTIEGFEMIYTSFSRNLVTGEEVIEIISSKRMKDFARAMPGRDRGYNVIVEDREGFLKKFDNYEGVKERFLNHKWSFPKFTRIFPK